jgi:hypothetical protein
VSLNLLTCVPAYPASGASSRHPLLFPTKLVCVEGSMKNDSTRYVPEIRVLGQDPGNGGMARLVLEFTVDGDRRLMALKRSALLGQAQTRRGLVNELTDRGLMWPGDPKDDKPKLEVLEKLVKEAQTAPQLIIAELPGWYGNLFILPDREYGPDDAATKIVFVPAESVHIGEYVVVGPGIARWRKKVARVARHSSRVRLAIAAAFAAPLIRPTGAPSFGFNFFGPTSIGKTSCLRTALSVWGLTPSGVVSSWLASPTGIEQHALGHRDSLVCLDDFGNIAGSGSQAADTLAATTFLLTGNRPKRRDKGYELKAALPKMDWRLVLLSTGVESIDTLISRGGRPLKGEEVRLIDVPAQIDGGDIFHSRIAKKGEKRSAAARRILSGIEKQTVTNQGHAIRHFLQKILEDKNYASKINKYSATFAQETRDVGDSALVGRIRKCFALSYSAAALAVDYGTLAWKKKATRRDIATCFRDAIEHLSAPQLSKQHEGTSALEQAFDRRVVSGKIKEIVKRAQVSNKDAKKRLQADGFAEGEYVYIKAERLKLWFPDPDERKRLLRELKVQRLLQPGREGGHTVEKKPPYFAFVTRAAR